MWRQLSDTLRDVIQAVIDPLMTDDFRYADDVGETFLDLGDGGVTALGQFARLADSGRATDRQQLC